MPDERIVAALTRTPLFARLTDEQRRALADSFERRRLLARVEIFREGDRADAFYVVAAGQVEIVKGAHGDAPKVLATLGPGSYFGEMGLVEAAPRSAGARMASPGELLTLTKPHFQAMVQTYPSIAMQLNAEIIRRHRQNVKGALVDDEK
jgi:CRP-like cAMP-binding protein